MINSLLHHFHLDTTSLLGKGGESEVYALDSSRVLRIYKAGMPEHYIQQRRAFYTFLDQQHPPFELPVVLDQGSIDDRSFTIERRMRGRDFAQVLPGLTNGDRRHALASYLAVAAHIGTIQYPMQPFGELLSADLLQRDTWPQFLWDRLQHTFQTSRTDVERDVPQIDRVLAYMRSELHDLDRFGEKCLVHGDYFPANVFIDDTLTVCGVGDFGYTTVVGDARMDLAGAIAFLEVVDGYQPHDTVFLMQTAVARHGAEVVRWITFYRLYYSFYFSHCKADDPKTYAWCIRNFQSWLDATRSG